MPMPYTYRHASAEFAAFLADLREELGHSSDNVAYTTTDAVFQVFRRRLSVPEALMFADVLPCVLRAIFLWHWTPEAAKPFGSRVEMTKEVQAVRAHHNWAPDHAILAVARCLRACVLSNDLDPVLARLPEGSVAFWALPEGEVIGDLQFP